MNMHTTTIRKGFLAAILAITGSLALSACQKEEAATETVSTAPTRPTSATNTDAWQGYLGHIVQKNMQGMTGSRPYVYYVPPGDDQASQAQYFNQLRNVSDTVARTVIAGNMMAFGGPSSAKTGNLMVSAFENASPGSFEGVIVLFIGDEVDRARVEAAVKPSGAIFRFAQM